MRPLPLSRLTLPRLPDPAPDLLDYLSARFPHVPPSVWHERFRRGVVTTADGVALNADSPCVAGAIVLYERDVEGEPLPESDPRIVYRDERIIIVDKPPYVPVTPAGAYVHRSMLAMLRRFTGLETLTPIHRLDRDTSGLVLFVCDNELRSLYHRLFAERSVERVYEAIAASAPVGGPTTWTIANRLGSGEPWFRQREVPGPVNAITHIQLIERDGETARYRLRPETGRKHQLRVHMASLGTPIVNDRLYPTLDRTAYPEDDAHALRLTAVRLTFTDPVTAQRIDVERQYA